MGRCLSKKYRCGLVPVSYNYATNLYQVSEPPYLFQKDHINSRTQTTKLKFSNLLLHLYFQASDTVGPLNVFSVMVMEEDTIIHILFYFPSLSFINGAPFLNGNEE